MILILVMVKGVKNGTNEKVRTKNLQDIDRHSVYITYGAYHSLLSAIRR